MKYPHNLFLETGYELGTVGLITIVFLLFNIFNSVRKISGLMFFFYLYPLWLAVFSKDIASQSLLWSGIAFCFCKKH